MAVGWLVARWCATPGFDDHHVIWLMGGALVGHSLRAVASGIADGSTLLTVVLGAVIVGATVLLLGRLDRHVGRPGLRT